MIQITYLYVCDHCGADAARREQYGVRPNDVIPAPAPCRNVLHSELLCQDCADLARNGLEMVRNERRSAR